MDNLRVKINEGEEELFSRALLLFPRNEERKKLAEYLGKHDRWVWRVLDGDVSTLKPEEFSELVELAHTTVEEFVDPVEEHYNFRGEKIRLNEDVRYTLSLLEARETAEAMNISENTLHNYRTGFREGIPVEKWNSYRDFLEDYEDTPDVNFDLIDENEFIYGNGPLEEAKVYKNLNLDDLNCRGKRYSDLEELSESSFRKVYEAIEQCFLKTRDTGLNTEGDQEVERWLDYLENNRLIREKNSGYEIVQPLESFREIRDQLVSSNLSVK